MLPRREIRLRWRVSLRSAASPPNLRTTGYKNDRKFLERHRRRNRGTRAPRIHGRRGRMDFRRNRNPPGSRRIRVCMLARKSRRDPAAVFHTGLKKTGSPCNPVAASARYSAVFRTRFVLREFPEIRPSPIPDRHRKHSLRALRYCLPIAESRSRARPGDAEREEDRWRSNMGAS
jgi:hypothetical protein